MNELDRKLMGYFAMRDGKTGPSPIAGIFGPKVMIINESAGSGGDALPYYVPACARSARWSARGRGVGSSAPPASPPTIDGGGITAPSFAFYDLNGKWAVENEGVTPDIEVEYSPAEVIKGHDPQLERAVAGSFETPGAESSQASRASGADRSDSPAALNGATSLLAMAVGRSCWPAVGCWSGLPAVCPSLSS